MPGRGLRPPEPPPPPLSPPPPPPPQLRPFRRRLPTGADAGAAHWPEPTACHVTGARRPRRDKADALSSVKVLVEMTPREEEDLSIVKVVVTAAVSEQTYNRTHWVMTRAAKSQCILGSPWAPGQRNKPGFHDINRTEERPEAEPSQWKWSSTLMSLRKGHRECGVHTSKLARRKKVERGAKEEGPGSFYTLPGRMCVAVQGGRWLTSSCEVPATGQFS
ncbi:formin-like protein 14 [Mus pahari]|uniref:formin-like protein 14 n=1 Tax=Mus pahari TaxID=10093 RepID=UPI00111498C1|nr:formin-like protein 14 [Mus pahari]